MSTVGIDFGTATTVAAISAANRVSLVRDAHGDEIIPSYLALLPNATLTVGKKAKARMTTDPENTIGSVKRILGKPWGTEICDRYLEDHPALKLQAGDDGFAHFCTRTGVYGCTELATALFEYVFHSLQRSGRPDPERVTVTVPTTVNDAQREATVEAAVRAGFKEVATIEESLAAALAYVFQNPKQQTLAVFDLGGGTFDFSVLRVTGHAEHKVLASVGHPHLGGDDIDRGCAEWANEEVLKEFRVDLKASPTAFGSLIALCERAKVLLSLTDTQTLNLGEADPNLEGKTIELRRDVVDRFCADVVQRTFSVVDEAMHQAGLFPKQLDSVLLCGGTSYIPAVGQAVRDYFGQFPRVDFPPDRIVAMGAALHASSRGIEVKPLPKDGPERRQWTRHDKEFQVRFEMPGTNEVRFAKTSNISLGGFFVLTDDPPEMGVELVTEIEIPERGSVIVRGVVAWVLKFGAVGFGIKITDAPQTWYDYTSKL